MGDTLGHYAAYKGLMKVLDYLIQRGDRLETYNTVRIPIFSDTLLPLM